MLFEQHCTTMYLFQQILRLNYQKNRPVSISSDEQVSSEKYYSSTTWKSRLQPPANEREAVSPLNQSRRRWWRRIKWRRRHSKQTAGKKREDSVILRTGEFTRVIISINCPALQICFYQVKSCFLFDLILGLFSWRTLGKHNRSWWFK